VGQILINAVPGSYSRTGHNFRIADYTSTGQRVGLGSAASSGNNRQGDKADHTAGTRDNIASAFLFDRVIRVNGGTGSDFSSAGAASPRSCRLPGWPRCLGFDVPG
jgi:hypothetical protein